MRIFKKLYQVKPNTVGFLYRDNVFVEKWTPGRYKIWDPNDRTEMLTLPQTLQIFSITNQEVLTKDNIALRFSFNVLYTITDGHKFLNQFAQDGQRYLLGNAEVYLKRIVQLSARKIISELDSDALNEKRNDFSNLKTEEVEKEAAVFGITIERVQIIDLTFPKSIQDLFMRQLEAKIRAKADLENARTAVAVARALKNASELMKDDDNIKFFQMIETISKIAEKGKHTFMIGDIHQLMKK